MQHRDKVVLQKIISEIDVGIQMLGDNTLDKIIAELIQEYRV